MKLLRDILFPVVPVYHAITWLRNKAFDNGILESKSYELPIITVGNLSTGGTGKTPMIEFLIRLLKDDYKVATLSRGYKRDTKGFVIADEGINVTDIGDEPFQFYNKFQDVIVSVDADRQNGISQLFNLELSPEVILLDDAFQHRKVNAGLTILLTTYTHLYVDDFVLPTGNLREPKSGAKRADIIIVTKCPHDIETSKKEAIINALQPLSHQHVFFSTITYANEIYSNNKKQSLKYLKGKSFTLVTGIANANPLLEFLNAEKLNYEHLNFKDHHKFTSDDIKLLKTKSLIITTEKDFMRLKDKIDSDVLYYLPIETSVFESEDFNKLIINYVRNF